MKDKIENLPPQIPQDFRSVSRPHSSYASSASSTSSYASSLSSASNASDSGKYSSTSASFLHSKTNPMLEVTPDRISQYSQQYHTLRRYNSGTPSETTPQLTTPSQQSPSSSPASSTFEGYATLPNKYATLSLSHGRQESRIHYPNPSMPTTPVTSNFRHSLITDGNSEYGRNQNTMSNFTRVVHGDLNRSRTFLNTDGTAANGMRGISSLGEVVPMTTNGHRSAAHYASTPHLFVFQSVDDESGSEDEINRQITKSNTLSNKNVNNQDGGGHSIASSSAKCSMTLPRLTSPPITPPKHSNNEPIYTSTTDIKKNSHVKREEEATHQINEHYEIPRTLTSSRRSSSCSMIAQDSFTVTNDVVARIETSFRGHKTQMWVCRTMANLYTEEGSGKDATWKLQFTGVPALMLDLGETKSRNKRQLQIILAERESGFELWKDVIDNLTSYKVSEPHFHTLYLSSDHRRKIGLSFNEGQAAMVFHSHLETLTSNPENISLSAPGKKKSKPKEKKPIKYKAPRKTDISTPCNFHHVTTVDITDRSKLYSLQVYGNSSPLTPPQVMEPHTVVNRPIPTPSAAATAV